MIRIEMRQARKAKGFSHHTLALELGVTSNSIRHIEAGRQHPNLKHGLQLAKILDTPPDVLFADLLESHDS